MRGWWPGLIPASNSVITASAEAVPATNEAIDPPQTQERETLLAGNMSC